MELHYSTSAADLCRLRCLHSLIPSSPPSLCFPSPVLHIPFPDQQKEKTKKKKKNKMEPSSGNLSPRLMIGVWANTSGKSSTAVMRCLAASCSLSSFSKNAVLLVSWVPSQQGGCSWRYIAVGRQPKPGWSRRCK